MVALMGISNGGYLGPRRRVAEPRAKGRQEHNDPLVFLRPNVSLRREHFYYCVAALDGD